MNLLANFILFLEYPYNTKKPKTAIDHLGFLYFKMIILIVTGKYHTLS